MSNEKIVERERKEADKLRQKLGEKRANELLRIIRKTSPFKRD